jgi:hypothetical protein
MEKREHNLRNPDGKKRTKFDESSWKKENII